jgi:hypothetical protein
MALVVKDRVKETTTSTGTGTITLAGAVAGFQSFSVIGDANTTYYAIVGPTEWEVGVGTYTASGTTLSRDTVLESTNANALVNFSAGEKEVFVTYPASRAVDTELVQTLTNKTLTDPEITGTIREDRFTITDGASVDIDPANGSIQTWTLGANRTPTATNWLAGESITLMIVDGTAYTITWTTIAVNWIGGSPPTLSTTTETVIQLWKRGSTVFGALVGFTA